MILNTLTKEDLLGLTEMLQKQLLAYSASNEIGKIIAQSQNIEAVFNGLCLGFKDLMGYNRAMVLGIDSENFCLKPLHSTGFDEEKLKDFHPEINFMAGEYADAIFCNKHILADPVPNSDAFSLLGCKAYTVFPLLKRVIEECWQAKSCDRTNCPCYESENQYCWTNLDAGLATNTKTEDDRRRSCTRCKQFKCEGLLWLDLTDRHITSEEVAMIYVTVAQAGLIIETFKVYEDLMRTNEKLNATYDELQRTHHILKSDLQQANSIQQQLLPTSFPKGLLDVFADYKTSLDIGGDYYDCFQLRGGLIGFVVADVSGHGTAAAMMMSMFKIMLKSSPLNNISPAMTLKNINKTLIAEIDSSRFITVFYATWSKDTRKFTYTSAGHNPMPLMNKKTGEIELLKSSGLFIGVMPDITVEDTVLKLDGEYRINLYTDGINEAMNAEREQFGHKRIHELMKSSVDKSCKEFVETLLESVDVFRGRKELVDDATILVCDL